MPSMRIATTIIGSLCLGSVSSASFADPIGESSRLALADSKAKGDPVEIDKLPKAVVDAVKKELPGARLTKAMKLPDGNYFLTDVKVGKKEYNVTVTPDGKILKREVDND
jgi:hypothetical protein